MKRKQFSKEFKAKAAVEAINPKNAVKKDAPVESSLTRHCRDYSYQS